VIDRFSPLAVNIPPTFADAAPRLLSLPGALL